MKIRGTKVSSRKYITERKFPEFIFFAISKFSGIIEYAISVSCTSDNW